MPENTTNDYSGLSWVKEEIDSTLKQARQALEEYVENPDDETQLRFCITYIHQVFGTLHMVELYGASLFAEEMEELANALLNGQIRQKEEAYEVLMRAIIQLPDYLEKVQSGLRDDPLLLLPLLNDIRTLRSAKLLSENALISVEIDAVEPIEFLERDESLRDTDIRELAKHHRQSFQLGLLGWYRGHDEDAGLKSIDFVLSQLEQASRTDEFIRLWWVARGVVESLLDGGLESSSTLKLLLGNLDREIKAVISDGEAVGEPVIELAKNLLYYVAQSTSAGERVIDVLSTV